MLQLVFFKSKMSINWQQDLIEINILFLKY